MRGTIFTVVILVVISVLVCRVSAGSGYGQWPSARTGHWGFPGGQLGSWGGKSGYYGMKRRPILSQRPMGSYYGGHNKGFNMNWPTSFQGSNNWNQGIWQFSPGNSGPWAQRSVYPWTQTSQSQWGPLGTQTWGQGINNNPWKSGPNFPGSWQSWNSFAPGPQLPSQMFNNPGWSSPLSGDEVS